MSYLLHMLAAALGTAPLAIVLIVEARGRRRAVAHLETRIRALETEVHGPPTLPSADHEVSR